MTTPQKSWPWMKIVLIVSLGLNLLVIGAVIGSTVSKRDTDRKTGQRTELSRAIGIYGGVFNEADRAEIRRDLRAKAPEFRRMRQEMRQVGADVVDVLRADPFDPAALDRVLERQVAAAEGMRNIVAGTLAERIGAMTAQERSEFADRLEQALQRPNRIRR